MAWLAKYLGKLLRRSSDGAISTSVSAALEPAGLEQAAAGCNYSAGADSAEGSPQRNPTIVAFCVNERGKFGTRLNGTLFVKARALLPRKIGGRFELSTFCIDGMDGPTLWGFLNASASPTKQLAGRSDFKSVMIRNIDPLKLDPNWEPERHVNVHNWPDDEPHRKSIAQRLSDIGNVVSP